MMRDGRLIGIGGQGSAAALARIETNVKTEA
jgi:hypothetical protein